MLPGTPLLSKSTFVRGHNCLKSLYLYKNHYNLKDKISAAQQNIFDQGHEIGKLAQELFPNGYNAAVLPAYDYQASLAKTQKALQDGHTIIYEAGFVYNQVYAAIDILVVKEDGWYIYEVKSSRSIKPYQHLDVAVQLYILQGLGLPVKAVHIVHVKKEFIRRGPVKPTDYFLINDVTAVAQSLQGQVEQKVAELTQMLLLRQEPPVPIGPQCDAEFTCDFWGHCWRAIESTAYPIHTISRLGKRKWEFIKQGIFCQSQITPQHTLNEGQRMQVVANQTQTSPPPDTQKLQAFLNTLRYPLAFLDFETFDTVLPLFDGTYPKQPIPFQYSLHIMREGGEVQHFEYLGDGKADPRPVLVERLVRELEGAQTILCYNVTFEKTRLQELIRDFPAYREPLQNICERLVDLIVPFRSRLVYHYKMNGSASIKDVLPALLPHLSYKDLAIQEGISASLSYLKLYSVTDPANLQSIREALLAYCKLDTWAMVELYRYLKQLCANAVICTRENEI